ncbi:MAG: cyclohexanone monooxygenase [Nocardioidaceae bacterium]|nr:cyclohexanone monooxygenase [Nocardioidaceae bacterium]
MEENVSGDSQVDAASATPDYDVVVVGAGMGGIYAVHKFKQEGLSVVGFEGAPDVGGVWYHNRYPGARVDVESFDYCFFFDPALYQEWKWTERYPPQPEILAYLGHVADRYDVRRHFSFNTWVSGAQWNPENNWYEVTTDTGQSVTGRFLVMTTGQLSKARKPNFPGLDDFEGEWVQTSHWPDRHVQLEGRKVGIIGTGSSGSQAITEIAKVADHLTVFQRTPNYAIPALNGPLDREKYDELAARVPEVWEGLQKLGAAANIPSFVGLSTDFTPEEQQAILEDRWRNVGGQSIVAIFLDQGISDEANALVSNFARDEVRRIVKDPEVAEILVPDAYPIGTRRLAVTSGYYETFNRDNVTLVDLLADPIETITATGIKTRDHEYDLDLIVFSLGFTAFTGSIDNANIRNEAGKQPSDNWKRGPKTYLGLTTREFPNLFLVTGPGSPSVLANMIVDNVQHVDLVAGIIAYMSDHGYTRIEPSEAAQDAWGEHVQEVARPLIRYRTENYMVHVNKDDGSRVFMPYAGGYARYVEECKRIIANDYEGFEFA